MTYKFQLLPQTSWLLQTPDGQQLPMTDLFLLLDAIERVGHIAGAGKHCGMSYRHAWGVLRRAESIMGTALLTTHRRRGSQLTHLGQQWLAAYRKAVDHLSYVQEDAALGFSDVLARLQADPNLPRLRLCASYGFAVEAMVRTADTLGLMLELHYRTATEALMALSRNECDLAGFQVPAGAYQADMLAHYRRWLDADKYCLIYLAQRDMGLFVKPGNPKGIHGIRDLTAPDVRFVNLPPGSSTRLLLEAMMAREGLQAQQIHGYASSEFTHMAVAAHIASGMADAGMGVRTAAQRCGLDFIFLTRERYFFAVRTDRLDWPLVRQWRALLGSPSYTACVRQLPGYDPDRMGTVLTLTEAFDGQDEKGAETQAATGKKAATKKAARQDVAAKEVAA